MAREVGIFLCLLIVIMDVTAGILGIEAEIAQNKVCLFDTINIIGVVLRSHYDCIAIEEQHQQYP